MNMFFVHDMISANDIRQGVFAFVSEFEYICRNHMVDFAQV